MAASRCFIFMYFLLPHWVPATWRSRAQTSMRAELPSGKLPTTRVAASDLPVQPFNDIVGADTGPVLTGKIAVGQSLINAVLHLLSGLLQFHGTEFFYHGFGLFTGCFLALLAWIALSILATSFTLERGVTENTLR